MTVVAWAYMVESDSGLTKEQIKTLMHLIPDDVEVVPFSNDVLINNQQLLEANSIAYGFIDSDHFDNSEEVQQHLATICNDWENEKDDKLYITESGLQVMMF